MTSFRYSRSGNNAIKIAEILIDETKMNGLSDDDYDRIKNLLKLTNIKVHLRQCDNDTLMHLAIRRKDVKLIEWFLNGSDLTMKNDFGETPYDLAVKVQCDKEILTKLLRGDEIISMNDMNEDFYIELRSKITTDDCDKLKFIKAVKIVDHEFVLSSAIDENFCDIFPNLFALQIEIPRHDEENCLKLIKSHFNDGRPMFVNFIASEKFFLKNENANEFTAITSDDNNARIINTKTLISSEVVDLIKSNDTFAMRYLKLFKIPNEFKVIDSAIEFGSFEMFLAALSAPFDNTKIENYLPDISKLISSVYNHKSILMSAVKSDKIEIINFIIQHFKSSLKFLPFDHKKSIVNLISDKNLDDILISLLNIDFPFPENLNNNNENIKKLLKDRQKLRSDDLEYVEEFIEQNKSVKIGYNKKNQSALLYAIENKNIQIYSYLLSEGYHCEDPNERKQIQEIIRTLEVCDKNKLRFENVINSKSDGNNHIRLLTNKFVIFTHYEDKDEFTANFNKISKYLTELNEVYELRKLLKFCAELHMLKVTFDCENYYIRTVDPTAWRSLGKAYSNGFLIVSAVNEQEAKSTLIHELTHIALLNYYENDFNPYFAYDDGSRVDFKYICDEIKDYLEHNDDQCDKIISSVFSKYDEDEHHSELIVRYDEDEHHSELIVRVLEILAYYKKDDKKISNLRRIYKKLFDFSEKHVTNALSIDDYTERLKIRSGNKYFGLIQEIEEKSTILKLSKKSKHTKKIEKIIKSSESQLIVTNIPILALINIKDHLLSAQKSLYDSKNAFISIKYIENNQIYDDFQEIITNSSEKFNTIVDFSADHHIRVFDDKLKLIIITNEQKLSKIKEILTNNDIFYEEKSLTYTWNDLKLNSQEFLMQTEVKFQNKTVKLNKITTDEIINEELVLKLCYEHEIGINLPSNDNDEFYIERKFAKIIQNEYQESVNLTFNQNEQTHMQLIPDEATNSLKPIFVKTNVEIYSMDEALNKTANEKIVLISDIGGSGKSRVLKEMSKKLMSSCDNWILFIDLRKYLTEFLQWEDEKMSINFLKFFHAYFGKNLTEFERKIFENFYMKGKVKILFDGFDEISPNCKQFVLELINSIEFYERSFPSSMLMNQQNQIWITTRKHLEIDLQEKLKVNEIFNLQLLNPVDQVDFLIKYWKSKEVKLNPNETLEANAKVLQTKFSNFTQNKGNLIGIMQQLQILAEISIKNQKLNIASIENFTMYDIYEKSLNKFIDKWRNDTTLGSEKCSETQRSSVNFTDIHQYHALLVCFKKEIVEAIFANSGKKWDQQSIARGGIITYENDKFFFIHATYIEFFIADFFIENLRKTDSWPHFETFLRIFCDILIDIKFATVQMFINEKIDACNFSDEEFEIFAKYWNENFAADLFQKPLCENYHNLTKFLLRILQKFSHDKIKSVLNSSELDNPLYVCMFSNEIQNSGVFGRILDLALTHLSDEEFIEMVGRNSTLTSHTFIHLFACKNVNLDMVKSLMEIIIDKCIKSNTPVKELLMKRCKMSLTPILSMIHHFETETFTKLKYFWKIYEKYLTGDEMIKNIYFDEVKYNAFGLAASCNYSKVFEYLYKRFTSKYNLNFIDMICECKINSIFNVVHNKNISVHHVMWNCFKKEVERDELNRKKIRQLLFTYTEEKSNYILVLMAVNDSREILQLNLSNMKNFMDNPMEILNLQDINNRNLFQITFCCIKTKDFYQDLWYFIKDLHKHNNHKLQRFLNHRDINMNNVFHIALAGNTRENIEMIIKFAEEVGMRSSEFKNFIMPKQSWNGKNRNILHFAAEYNRTVEAQELAWLISEKYLTLKEISSLFTDTDERNLNLLQIVVACNQVEVVKFTWEKIKFHLNTFEKQKFYIQKLGYQNKNLFELSLMNAFDIRTRMWTAQLYNAYGLEIPTVDSSLYNEATDIRIVKKEGSQMTFQIPVQMQLMSAMQTLPK